MTNRKRQGNNPKRRIAPADAIVPEVFDSLSSAGYVGSAHHKSKPADYGFNPPVNPRPDKSLCDDIRAIGKGEAVELFKAGIARGMVSAHQINGLPKYVWAVDYAGEAYEAVLSKGTNDYHGYRLEDTRDKRMRAQVIEEWNLRNPA